MPHCQKVVETVSRQFFLALALAFFAFQPRASAQQAPRLIVLGTAQDGGYPQAGCQLDCCQLAWNEPALSRFVSCVAVADPKTGERWLFDCTPDFREQLHLLNKLAPPATGQPVLHGILPTHAHVGHYAGLIHLGREVMGAHAIPVFCLPRMKYFLETQGPWEQMVALKQIDLQRIAAGNSLQLNNRLSVTPILVPHRDEYSETVAFRIEGPQKSVLYLPDIDKWEKWQLDIREVVQQVDIALLDATFYDEHELPGRDMKLIPHPFVVESLALFAELPSEERNKIQFIHLNHSNPALRPKNEARRTIESAGLHVAQQGDVFEL